MITTKPFREQRKLLAPICDALRSLSLEGIGRFLSEAESIGPGCISFFSHPCCCMKNELRKKPQVSTDQSQEGTRAWVGGVGS